MSVSLHWEYGRGRCFPDRMTRCCAIFVSLFGGYFLAAYAIDQLGKKLLGREDQYELNQQFVGYSMVVTFVLDIVSGLFSISILHWILQFYTIFVVFEGARTLMKVNEEKLTRYTLIASVIIIVCPALIAQLVYGVCRQKISSEQGYKYSTTSCHCYLESSDPCRIPNECTYKNGQSA